MLDNVQPFVIPLIVLAVLIAAVVAPYLISRNYLKVSPNVVAVLSGRRRKLPDGRVVGYRMVRGGAAFRIPVLEKVEYLHLNVMTIPLEIKRAYTLKGVPVSVKAVANVKIRGDETSLQAASERFLSMTHDTIQKVIFQTLEGHLRSILGTLTVEEVNQLADLESREVLLAKLAGAMKGTMAKAAGLFAAPASQMPRKRTLPSRTSLLIAPIVSSIGTVGSTLWM